MATLGVVMGIWHGVVDTNHALILACIDIFAYYVVHSRLKG